MKGRTVLLVNSNRMQPPIAPLALDYVGAALKQAGCGVRLLDLCLEKDAAEAVGRAFEAGRPDLAAVSFRNTDDCYFASRVSFVDRLRDDVALIREHYGGPVVVGGGGFSVLAERLAPHVGGDYGVRGDGEPALLQLLKALSHETPFSEVPGLVYREGGTWRANAPSRADLDAFDLAARDIVDNATYFRLGGQVGLETKRGCPNRCIYCADPVIKGSVPRLRAPAEVVEEVRDLVRRGIDVLHLCDSEFNVPVAHAEAVCRAMAEAGLGEKVGWYAYASPHPFSPALAELMRLAGCVGIDFGADSGSDAMLRALGRDHDAACLESTARACREAGLVFMYDLLLGGPGETPETVAETVALMKKIRPDRVGVSLGVRVYPGTSLAEKMNDAGAVAGLVGDPAGLAPFFYISPALGDDPAGLVRRLIGDDPGFFLPGGGTEQDYNYNDNTVLTNAIGRGYRGAYWDILRRLQDGIAP